MSREKEEIIKQYRNLLYNEHPHKRAAEMTADLFGIDTETVIAILEDANVIPHVTPPKNNIYGHFGSFLESSADAYYRELCKKKKELEDNKASIQSQINSIDKKMKEVEGYAQEILEIRDASKKANKK